MPKLTNVKKYYDKNVIINDVSFEVGKNTIVGLAGPSGSGKSTLLRCIQGLVSVDAGKIDCPEKVGFVFQDFQLFPHMTVLENVSYAPKNILNEVDYKEKATSLLEQLGLADKADSYPGSLSGGQKQRVAMCRTLAMHPDLLLCDEPTSGLDIASIVDVVALLKKVHGMGVTIIIASHDLDFISKISDRVLMLKDGQIVADFNTNTTDNIVAELKKYYE